jgi:hypothetical protein
MFVFQLAILYFFAFCAGQPEGATGTIVQAPVIAHDEVVYFSIIFLPGMQAYLKCLAMGAYLQYPTPGKFTGSKIQYLVNIGKRQYAIAVYHCYKSCAPQKITLPVGEASFGC